ncbi:MAG: hypothetical protein KGI69_02545 [Patescibacteria group bacterium]|nr:hypothetical protein [Patescibacteria group bacterium]
MALDTKDRKYIADQMHTISSHYFGILKETFDDRIGMLAELIQDRPTLNEVRDMIRQETSPIEARLTRIEGTLDI